MLPKIAELEFNTETEQETAPMGSSFLFDFEKGDFVLKDGRMVKASDTEAIKVWIQKVLRTELNIFNAYEGTEYGVKLEDLLGYSLPFAFVESEMQREIRISLTQHPKIQGISNFAIEREKSLLKVQFKVDLVGSDAFVEEVTFDVRG